jgi:hypothetical protein
MSPFIPAGAIITQDKLFTYVKTAEEAWYFPTDLGWKYAVSVTPGGGG